MNFMNYLERITGVSIYAQISFVLFGLIFTIMTVWAIKADKKMIEEISKIPLDINS